MKRKLLEITAIIACLNVWGGVALADPPNVSAQPDVRPSQENSTVGGSASASGGSAGPATVSSSQPITTSSSSTTGSNSRPGSTTTATGPGTTATAPTNAWTAQPDPSAPDGSAPTPTTSGPTTDADANKSSVSISDSRARVNLIAIGRNAFGGSLSGIGGAEDPTFLSTCSTAEASPGVPTDASLTTSCTDGPSTASEDFGANQADGNAAAGNPSASSCLGANASAGSAPTAALTDPCTAATGAGPATGSNNGDTANGNGENAGSSSPSSNKAGASSLMSLLGVASLPSSATAEASAALLGAAFIVAGLVLIRRQRAANLPKAMIARIAGSFGRTPVNTIVTTASRHTDPEMQVTRAFRSEGSSRPRRGDVA